MVTFLTLLCIIGLGILWGHLVQKIIDNKGYSENWFWWGFFFGPIVLLVALLKPDMRTAYPTAAAAQPSHNLDNKMLEAGGWKCTCGKVNPSYTATCTCGTTKKEIQDLEKLEKIKSYKELLDTGVITEEEYEAKRKEILG